MSVKVNSGSPVTFNTLGTKLRRAAAAAKYKNSLEQPVMASPPTITTGTSTLDASLSKTVYFTVSAADAAKFKFRGGNPTVSASIYYRFPVVTLPSGTGNSDATHNANQWAVEFYTDAPKIQIFALNSTSTNGLAFEVDGQAVSASPTAFPATSGGSYFLLDFSSVGGRATRRIRVEGDMASGMRGVTCNPIDSVWAPSDIDGIKAAVVGDSVTAGTGASMPNGDWAISLGKILGWTDVRQVALGGTGWINQGGFASTFADASRIADVVSFNPDVLVLTGSSNDIASSPAAITAAVLAGLRAYRAALPSVTIILGGIWPGVNAASATYIAAEGAIASAFTAFADSNSYYVPIIQNTSGSWITGTGRVGTTNASGNSDIMVIADQIHPSQAGHNYFARR